MKQAQKLNTAKIRIAVFFSEMNKMMDFTSARYIAKMSRLEVMEYLNISESTIKRYEAGKTPKAIIECLRMIGGHCPEFCLRNDFSGWSFGSGYLHSPEGNRFTSGDIRAIYADRELIKELTRNNAELKKRVSMSVPDNVYPFPAIHKKYEKLKKV